MADAATDPNPSAAASPPPRRRSRRKPRAHIRMYRGLGDCFLITLPGGPGGEDYFILIDCGILLGTPDATAHMTAVAEDIALMTGGRLDLLVATHEHWDHLSGFLQAADVFKRMTVEQVWLAWTEDPADELAKKLRQEREMALTALSRAVTRLRFAADHDTADAIEGLLGFFGAGKGATTREALEAVRGMSPTVKYCRPDQPGPEELPGGQRLFVLGPPVDEKLLRKTRPSSRTPETYVGLKPQLDDFADNIAPALHSSLYAGRPLEPADPDPDAPIPVAPPVGPESPFTTLNAIPLAAAEEMDFFKGHYGGGEAWRRIDAAWLDGSTELALQLDSATNNTSLVLAIELAVDDKHKPGDILLFAADAQVGSWLSWEGLEWTVDGGKVTGRDLLRRTILYKVGHHGSHNATLRDKGLELMSDLRFALVPVDQEIARKRRWHEMPLPGLITRLKEKAAKGGMLQSDQPLPLGAGGAVKEDKLYIEVTL